MDHHDEEFLRKAAAAKARVVQVEPAEVDRLIASGVTVVDVREPTEREKGTLPGSHGIAIGSLAQTIGTVTPDKSAPIVCFCNGGNRGSMAAAELLDLGYTNVKSIAGGLRAYVSHKEDE
jgi:rhodanese-related sulfurtransferase